MADEMNTERDMPEGITRDDTVHGETYYTAEDMATASAQGFRDGVASLSAPLQSALDVIERWARDAYVVCGKPATQEGFEAAWKAEDADAYAVWVAGHASLAANAPASFQGRVERHSDQSVLVVFPSCRLASEFERSLSPASPTIEGESK